MSGGPQTKTTMDPNAIMQQAVGLHQAGQLQQARQGYEQVLKFHPRHVDALNLLGVLYAQSGDLAQALGLLQKAVKAAPKHGGAQLNLARTLSGLGRFHDAIRVFYKAIALQPKDIEALLGLAIAQQSDGRSDQAFTTFKKASKLSPDHPAVNLNFGAALVSMGQAADAVPYLEKVIAHAPQNAVAHFNLGKALSEIGNADGALACFEKSISLAPGNSDAHISMGNVLLSQNRLEEAETSFRRALKSGPTDPAMIYANMARTKRLGRDMDGAMEILREGEDACPNSAKIQVAIGSIQLRSGDVEAAEATIRRAIDLDPNLVNAYFELFPIVKFKADDPIIDQMIRLANHLDQGQAEESSMLCFALAKAFDDVEQYDQAFDWLKKGNELIKARRPFETDILDQEFKDIAARYDQKALNALAGFGHTSEQPVFIVGMPRSGTTLVEQVLSSHPDVFGAGELLTLDRLEQSFSEEPIDAAQIDELAKAYLSDVEPLALGAKRITDKMPDNFRRLGLIKLLFPKAKIIHCRRNPVDTCLSCYQQLFTQGQGWSFDLATIGHYYQSYETLDRKSVV